MVTYITAQYRHVAVCSGLYPVRSQSLHGDYSSGCIESAMQPSSTEKSSRTTLHYVILNDSARDLVLPPLVLGGPYLSPNSSRGTNFDICTPESHCEQGKYEALLEAATDHRGRAKLLAAATKASGAWLNALPVSSLAI